jgi:hypothetical protein
MRLTKIVRYGCLQLCTLGLLVFVPATYGQSDITLRFLDSESGKPIRGISVSVFARDEIKGPVSNSPIGTVRIDKNSQVIKTDKEGKATFRVYQPTLKYLLIDSVGELRGCSARDFSMEEVLHSGLVADYHAGRAQWCGTLRVRATANPGEIVIFDKKITKLDHARQEIP